MNNTDDAVIRKYEDLLIIQESFTDKHQYKYFINMLKDTIYDLKIKKQARIESDKYLQKKGATNTVEANVDSNQIVEK